MPRRTLSQLNLGEIYSRTEIKKQETFNPLIERRWDKIQIRQVSKYIDQWEAYHDESKVPRQVQDIEDVDDITGKLLCQNHALERQPANMV